MKNTYFSAWGKTLERFDQWFTFKEMDKPLMRIVAPGKPGKPLPLAKPTDPSTLYLDAEYIAASCRNYCETHHFLLDAYPSVDPNYGPGSMTLYLGGEPGFAWDTLWYHEFANSPEEFANLHYDEENKWWKKHQKLLQDVVKLADDDFYVNIPDIVENLDILSAMRGPQNLCFDIIDNPDAVHLGVEKIDSFYFKYYDRLFDIVKDKDGISSYTSFNIFGKGKTGKIQCDFCAMISPEMFRAHVQESLRKQCKVLDYSVYHLDGPAAIKHVPALLEIKELDAIQWSYGAGNPDGGSERWYPWFDKAHEAGQGLMLNFEDGGPKDWARKSQNLVKRYGKKGLYLKFPEFPDLASAQEMAALFD
jgi:5-methyltetrahydrofolate--homocysteine methyltransferase